MLHWQGAAYSTLTYEMDYHLYITYDYNTTGFLSVG